MLIPSKRKELVDQIMSTLQSSAPVCKPAVYRIYLERLDSALLIDKHRELVSVSAPEVVRPNTKHTSRFRFPVHALAEGTL